ncbi:hypothetical protein F8M41_011528 [Gigaspora margarita]|uniref:Uncharacterized protein n=1 Tax=Gigaspora margarita TaxID=4874 RepID=A0A8H4ATX0_GIGMA|nr:hypothetical protein F8M41_011528 [Gigaspora margarita]
MPFPVLIAVSANPRRKKEVVRELINDTIRGKDLNIDNTQGDEDLKMIAPKATKPETNDSENFTSNGIKQRKLPVLIACFNKSKKKKESD